MIKTLIFIALIAATPAFAGDCKPCWYTKNKPEVNALMEKAYKKILKSNAACDDVDYVDESVNYSTNEYPIVYVQCKNGARFYFDESLQIIGTRAYRK